MSAGMEGQRRTVEDRLNEVAEQPSTLQKIIEGVDPGTTAVEDQALLMVVKAALDSGGKLQPALIDALMADLHKKLARQTDAILHNPDFQKLEAAWRGLWYLVENTDFGICPGCGLLDAGQRNDEFRKDRNGPFGNGKIFQSASGVHAPIRVGRHIDRPQRIDF